MNLLHLKYAVEVDKARSINKASEMLYMSQPNLSRAIKELEESLGITIFKRTPQGMTPTPQGEEFLGYARKILAQVDEVQALYKNEKSSKQTFSISVPRANYISRAFTSFAKHIDTDLEAEFFYKETNSLRAINNILQADYKLGIIRYQTIHESHFLSMLKERGLDFEQIFEFSYTLLMSERHDLARKKDIKLTDLSNYIEIAHADPFVPSLPKVEARKAELSEFVDKRIFVFERGSQFDLLSNVTNTFLWGSPTPLNVLERHGLVQRACKSNEKKYRDVLIFREGYNFSDLDCVFIDKLKHWANAMSHIIIS